MDFGDIEEMLFSFSPSQRPTPDAWGNSSEDELLDVPFEDVLIPWDQGSSPLLTAGSIKQQSGDSMLGPIAKADTNDMIPKLNHSAQVVRDRDWVISRIEEMLEKIVDGLLEDSEQLSLTLKSRSGFSRRQPRVVKDHHTLPVPKTREIKFPGNTAQEAWNFTVLVRILELVHGCLIDDTVMTKRDIYYRHPALFANQSVVDRYVDDLACTLGVPRSHLNVTAAAKGLVAGNFIVARGDGTSIKGLSEKNGILIPQIYDKDILDLSSTGWILIIEKEATFRSLLSSTAWEGLGSKGLVFTAKGYPDLASRKFLRQLADQFPHIPMFALLDFDPDGIAILSTYKYGSYRLAHEDVTRKDTPALSLPDLRWLGLQSHSISRTPVNESDTNTASLIDAQGLMKLTARDRLKALRMLEWNLCTEGGLEPVWRSELQRMLILNIKAEMQILEELPGGLVSWLRNGLDREVKQGSESPFFKSGSDDGLLF